MHSEFKFQFAVSPVNAGFDANFRVLMTLAFKLGSSSATSVDDPLPSLAISLTKYTDAPDPMPKLWTLVWWLDFLISSRTRSVSEMPPSVKINTFLGHFSSFGCDSTCSQGSNSSVPPKSAPNRLSYNPLSMFSNNQIF